MQLAVTVQVPRDDVHSPPEELSIVARITIGLGAAVVVAVVVLVAVFVYSIGKDQRKDLDVATVFGPDVYLADSREDIVDTTTEGECARLPNCVQSAESPRVRIMRFDSTSAAGAYVLQLAPYGYHSDWFIVEFLQPESMTRDEYRYVESVVYGTWSDSPD